MNNRRWTATSINTTLNLSHFQIRIDLVIDLNQTAALTQILDDISGTAVFHGESVLTRNGQRDIELTGRITATWALD